MEMDDIQHRVEDRERWQDTIQEATRATAKRYAERMRQIGSVATSAMIGHYDDNIDEDKEHLQGIKIL